MSHYTQTRPQDSVIKSDPIVYTRVKKDALTDPNQRILNAERQETKTVRWRVGWQTPAKMLGLLGLGILAAIGHHLLYAFLDSTPVRTPEDGVPGWKTQEWISRYGLGLAFITKTLLACAVAVAYKQRIWADFRQQPYTVAGINAMCDATTDIMSFGRGEFLWRAKMATLLAALTWTIPLSALIAPSSLLVTPTTHQVSRTTKVPALNYNSSLFRFSGMAGNVSPVLMRITSATASSGNILPMAAVASNASYALQFEGPSLKCNRASGFILKFMDEIHTVAGSAITSNVGGEAIYFGVTATPYYPYMNATQSPNQFNISHWNFSKIAEDCLRTPGRCPYSPTPYGTPASFPLLVRLDNESLACSLQNTSYRVSFESTETTQSIVHPYRFNWTRPVNLSWVDTDTGRASSTALSYAMAAQAIANLLNGIIGKTTSIEGGYQSTPKSSLTTLGSGILQTALIGAIDTSGDSGWAQALAPLPQEDQALARNKSIGPLIEELSRNQTLSLFSNPRFWSEDGMEANVTQSLSINIWQYRKENLWISYGLAIFAATFGVLVGLRAVYQNGISHDNNFSTIIATTRNDTLDGLTKGSSLGGETVTADLLRTKLMFGILDRNTDAPGVPNIARAAFGIPTEISPLRKGQAVS